MTFDFPLRARCIEPSSFFRRGEEVTVLRLIGADMIEIEPNYITKASRFKPIIRVRT